MTSAKILGTILNFLIVVGVARVLGADGKGITSLVLTTVFIIAYVAEIFAGQSMVILAQYYSRQQLLWQAYIWSFITAFGASLVLYFTDLFTGFMLLGTVLSAFFFALFRANSMLLVHQNQLKQFNLSHLITPVVVLGGLTVSFYLFQFKNELAYAFSLALGYGISWAYTLKGKGLLSVQSIPLKRILKSSLNLGLKFQLTEILNIIQFRWLFYVVGFFLGDHQLGIYTVAISIVEVSWQLARSVGTLVYRRMAVHETLPIKNLWQWMFAVMLICGGAQVLLFLLPSSVFTLVFGPAFNQLNALYVVLAMPVSVYGGVIVLQQYLAGKRQFKIQLGGSLLGILSMLLLLIFRQQETFTVALFAEIYGAGLLISASYQLLLFMLKERLSLRFL